MRVIDFADGFSSSAQPVAGVITGTALTAYANDAAFVAYLTGVGATLVAGSSYFNTTLGVVRTYSGSAWEINFEAMFGGVGNFIAETTFAVANNQVAAANVTGLLFNGAVSRSFEVDYHIYRNTTGAGATELAERGKLIGVYSTVAASWEMIQAPVVGDSGVTLSITAAGQAKYTSTNITGTAASSVMHFIATTMGI